MFRYTPFWIALTIASLSGCATVKPILYKAEKDQKTIYLLGSIHSSVGAREMPSSVLNLFDSSTVIFFESDPDTELEKILTDKKQAARYFAIKSDEPKLKSRLTDLEWDLLLQKISSYSPEVVNNFRPGLALILAQKNDIVFIDKSHRSLMNDHFLDKELMQRSQSKNIQTVVLDENVLNLCRQNIDQVNLESLKAYLNGKTSQMFLDEQLKLIDNYRAGNEEAIASLESGLLDTCILDSRNKSWLSKLDRFTIKGDKAFAVVGALHLLSTKAKNLLAYLREAGYSVSKVEEK